MSKVVIYKLVHRIKHPILRRYTRETHYTLTIDGKTRRGITIGVPFKSFKAFVDFAKDKYHFTHYQLVDNGIYHRTAQTL